MEWSLKSPARLAAGFLLVLVLGASGRWWSRIVHPRLRPLGAQPALHGLVLRWSAAEPPVAPAPGGAPPAATGTSSIVERALAADAAGLGRLAVSTLEAGLVSHADDTELWLLLVGASGRHPEAGGLSEGERAAVLAAVAAEPGGQGSPRLAGARAWDLLARGQALAALEALSAAPPGEVLALSARLRAQRELGQDPAAAALALHQAAPADQEACEEAARAALAEGDLAGADAVIQACQAAGVHHPPLDRLEGDVLDAAGEPAAACAAYLRAGTRLHAAAIAIQDDACGAGLSPDQVAAALAEPSPEAALHATWAAVLDGSPDRARQQLTALAALPQADGPPYRLAAAAALLLVGDAAGSLNALRQLQSAQAEVLRGRALAVLGQDTQAAAALERAVVAAPWAEAAHRERLAIVARVAPEALPAALADWQAADPVALALSTEEPDRLAPWGALAPDAWPAVARLAGPQADRQALAERLLVATPGAAGSDAADRALADRVLADRVLADRALADRALADRALADRVAAALPDDPVAQALAAVQASEDHQPGPAQARLARARALAPQGVAVLWAAANLALDQGQAVAADAAAAELVAAHPELPGARAFRYSVRAANQAGAEGGDRGRRSGARGPAW